jgi:hypothetical protein
LLSQAINKVYRVLAIIAQSPDRELTDAVTKVGKEAKQCMIVASATIYEAEVLVGSKLAGLSKRMHFTRASQELVDRMNRAVAGTDDKPLDASEFVLPFLGNTLAALCSSRRLRRARLLLPAAAAARETAQHDFSMLLLDPPPGGGMLPHSNQDP